MKSVYMAGPIFGCDDEQANTWRRDLSLALERYGIATIDPMMRDYRGIEDANVDAIVSGDVADIAAADAVVVKCDHPSWGTAMECRLAHAEMGKPVIGLCAHGTRVSPWLRAHTQAIVHTCEDAARVVAELLS